MDPPSGYTATVIDTVQDTKSVLLREDRKIDFARTALAAL